MTGRERASERAERTPSPDGELAGRAAGMLDLIEAAGREAMRQFRSPRLRVRIKSDATPVTEADLAIETLLRRGIRDRHPDDGVLGEEHGDEPGRSGWRWVIDPIDGTIAFAAGVPFFGILVALERAGRIEAGVCSMPALGEQVHAIRGGGAWWRCPGLEAPVPARVRPCRGLGEALVCVGGFEYFRRRGADDTLARVLDAAGCVRGWCDCLGGLFVATGRADGWIDPLMQPWDAAPFPILLAEAGGVFTDWTGAEGICGDAAIAGSPAVHRDLLALLRSVDAALG